MYTGLYIVTLKTRIMRYLRNITLITQSDRRGKERENKLPVCLFNVPLDQSRDIVIYVQEYILFPAFTRIIAKVLLVIFSSFVNEFT